MNYKVFKEVKEDAVQTAMGNLYFEVEKEYDPEVIKAKIKEKAIKKEVSPESKPN